MPALRRSVELHYLIGIDMVAIHAALVFILPAVGLTLVVPLVISTLFYLLSKLAKDAPAGKFFDALRVALGFGGYAMILGIFVGLTENLLVVTALGTITTVASTYLAYVYGKDATSDAKQILAPALLAFFITLPLIMEYTRIFLHT